MKHRRSLLLTAIAPLAFLSFVGIAAAQDDNNPLFLSQDLLEVRIEAPLYTLIRKRPDEEYLDGKFSYTAADGTEQTLDLKIRTRGKYRRLKKTCRLPPIRLNFRKGQVEDTEFAGEDKLKLVTHCKTSDRYEQLVLREYLAYRILNTLTDKSFGARLMRVTYVDSDGKEKPITRFGFVIEDDEDIADRIGEELMTSTGISYDELDRRQAILISVFEYMIGNTDFSLIRGPAGDDCCHNIVLYSAANNMITPIPYDFDFAGIVNAPYAEPNPQLPIKNVRTRFYRGRCMYNDYLDDTFGLLKEKEPAVRAELAALELNTKYAKEVTRYLDSFYKTINDQESIDKAFIKGCS